MSNIYCHNCGQSNADIARICRYCGTPLPTISQSSQQRPPTEYAPPQTDFGGIPSWATPPPSQQPAPVQPLRQPAGAPANFRCPHCQSNAPPVIAKRIGVAGWVVFFALLIFCFPLCFIGLFIKEEYRMCSWCRGAIA
ncbi:MAG TPA: LITAF-like zinc ribbon domain-containing protein [Pyrinomonadaceae bacterium]|nr:LITAF-like zinc ribbon domain-containing protein [Pyrinomonadaceae bacterium]